MNSNTAKRLAAINREFYDLLGASFSATRRRLQPGVLRILESLRGDENILDLGCGNGLLARTLASRGYRGAYLGIDSSPHMIREAKQQARDTSIRFFEADLIQLAFEGEGIPNGSADMQLQGDWNLIFAFAVLHHIPGRENREKILKLIRQRMTQGGRFIHSNWRFLNDAKMKARIQPWTVIGLSESELDEGDALLDWRSGGYGLRYVHQFSDIELQLLAEQTGFRILDVFYSDGRGGKMSLYQTWERTD